MVLSGLTTHEVVQSVPHEVIEVVVCRDARNPQKPAVLRGTKNTNKMQEGTRWL